MPDKQDILGEIRTRFEKAYDAVSDEYRLMINDLRFLHNDQWDSTLRADREADGRPCLTINKVANYHDQVCGDIRINSPSISVKPVDSDSDPDTAEKISGLIRNIEVQSSAEVAYDTAGEMAAGCGKGTFRIITDYADEDTFDQEIFIKRVKNPFSVFWDPDAQEWDKSDARYCFVTTKMDKDAFREEYPDAAISNAQGDFDSAYWGGGKHEQVRVAEYFRVTGDASKLHLIEYPDGTQETVSELPEGMIHTVLKTRNVTSRKIEWYKVTGAEVLEGPTPLAGRYIPIVEVWGKELTIENESHYRGIVRNAIDPQKLYNYSRSSSAEMISLAPKAPYLVTKTMIANYQTMWNQAHKKNFAYLPYDADPKMPGVTPQRTPPVQADSGIMQEIMIADQELHDTTGLQQANLGQKSNEKSGVAIARRQKEGDTANFAYYDNLKRGMTYAGKVLVDLIPHIYDTPKVRRILGEDGETEFVQFGEPFIDKDGKSKLYDLTTGKYDVVVNIGPSYSTQREESADNMMNFMGQIPATAPLIADLVVGQMDWPGSAQISDRLRKTLPPGLDESQDEAGAGQPPAGPPPPDPMQQMEMKKQEILMEQEQLKTVKLHAEIDKIRAETEIKVREALRPK